MFLIDISCRFCVQCSEEGRTEVSVTGQAEEINVNGLNDVYKDLCDLSAALRNIDISNVKPATGTSCVRRRFCILPLF